MPKECIDCRFITIDDVAQSCDRCGGHRLRFSMLAGMKFREQKSEAAKAKVGEDDRPGVFARLYQAAGFLIASQTATLILIGAGIFATPNDEVPKTQSFAGLLESMYAVYPSMTLLGAILIPAVAAAAAVVYSLRGAYLAQQVGLVLGPISAILSLAGVGALGGTTPALAWLFAPPLAAGAAFIAGLRMTGFIRAKDAEAKSIEYKPIDSWDRDAKPKLLDLRDARRNYHRKLFVGIIAGGMASYFFPFLLASMSGATSNEMATARTFFGWSGVCIAGAFAASGTNAPLLQGCLAGFLMYLVRHYTHFYMVTPEAVFQISLHIMAGLLGGQAGLLFFPPPRVVRGRVRCKSDGVVYVGDELAKNPV